MEERRLNDNEVKEVARMQSLINGYEAFILALFFMTKGNKGIDYPLFTDTPIDKPMNRLWKWVREQSDKKQHSIWHDASEKPDSGRYVLSTNGNDIGHVDKYVSIAEGFGWCYLDELIKTTHL